MFEDEGSNNNSKRYEKQEKIGEGTFGEVRKAVDRSNGRVVAIKYLPAIASYSSENMKIINGVPKSVVREMYALKQLAGNRGIVSLLDTFTEESFLCLVMEHLTTDLSKVIEAAHDYFSRGRLKCFFRMILESIAFCHGKKIIHRDVKPASTSI